MSKQVITLSDRAADRVKEIIANAKEPIVGVRVGVAWGGCAGMSYVMEYAKNTNPNDEIIEEIKKIYDPEIPVNIYELGLIYKIEVDDKNKVNIDMTLTSPNCPVAESLPNEVKDSIKKVEGVSDVNLNLVWEPPWDKDKMSEAAKLELNLWVNK